MFSSDHISCVIQYDDNPSAVYYSGNTVNYRATITFENPTEVKGILMKIQGKAYVEWVVDKRTVVGCEKYYKTKNYVVGGEGANVKMETGSYTYKSSEVLPINVPMSMRSEQMKGYIKHVVKIFVEFPLKSNKKFELPFTVLNSLDLNLHPQLKLPLELDHIKTFRFSSKKLVITGRVQKAAYVPGETINLYGEISNSSGIRIKYVNVTLKKLEYYTSGSNENRSVVTSICKSRLNEVSNHMSFSEKIVVPETMPSLLNMSNVVQVDYFVQIRCKVRWNHLSPKLPIPVLIGTIPYDH